MHVLALWVYIHSEGLPENHSLLASVSLSLSLSFKGLVGLQAHTTAPTAKSTPVPFASGEAR